MRLKPIKVLLTACGCPGASTLIRMLKKNGEREVEIIGVDVDDQAIGRFLADRFFQVPLADSSDYIPQMLDLAKRVQPDVLFPESSMEVYPLAVHKKEFEDLGVTVLVSNPEVIETASNEYEVWRVTCSSKSWR